MTDLSRDYPVSDQPQPGLETASDEKPQGGLNWLMMVCYSVMVSAIVMLAYFAPAEQSNLSWLTAFLPILACVGVHFFMHKLLGKPCHGRGPRKGNKNEDH
jgi:hypothetical protein